MDIWSHTNDTIGSVRRGILTRIKANATHTKIELFIGGEVVDPADDRKLIGQLNLKDKTVRMMGMAHIFYIEVDVCAALKVLCIHCFTIYSLPKACLLYIIAT